MPVILYVVGGVDILDAVRGRSQPWNVEEEVRLERKIVWLIIKLERHAPLLSCSFPCIGKSRLDAPLDRKDLLVFVMMRILNDLSKV